MYNKFLIKKSSNLAGAMTTGGITGALAAAAVRRLVGSKKDKLKDYIPWVLAGGALGAGGAYALKEGMKRSEEEQKIADEQYAQNVKAYEEAKKAFEAKKADVEAAKGWWGPVIGLSASYAIPRYIKDTLLHADSRIVKKSPALGILLSSLNAIAGSVGTIGSVAHGYRKNIHNPLMLQAEEDKLRELYNQLVKTQ